MAWYEIEYGCGHTIRKQLYGKNSERERYVKWAKTNKCPECKNKEVSEDAANWAKKAGLPKLTGTDKQIAWAEVIRKRMIYSMVTYVKMFAKELVEKYPKEIVRDALNAFKNHSSAKYWIDIQNVPDEVILKTDIEDIIKSEKNKKPATKKPAKKTTNKTHTPSKYGQRKQTGEVKNLGADQKRDAKPAGYRKSKSGNVYYEGRMNRSDCSPHESKKYKKR